MSETTFDRSVLGFEAGKLLETLLDRADTDGRTQIATAPLLKASGLTQGALVRARTELARHHLLDIQRGQSSSGLRGANIYVLNLDALIPSSPLEGDESGQNVSGDTVMAGLPAASRVRASSEEVPQPRKGLFSRMFRRQ